MSILWKGIRCGRNSLKRKATFFGGEAKRRKVVSGYQF